MRTFTAAVTGFDKLSNTDYAMTLEEIGAVEGITRERVRQIEKAALAKLRQCQMPTLLKMRELANTLSKNKGVTCNGVIR